jgi:hypothetical protein
MRSSVINEAKLIIPVPASPIIVDPDALTPEEKVSRMAFEGELKSCIKRKSVLDDIVQKACSLVIGQCAGFVHSKLKQKSTWSTTSKEQNYIALISLIKTVSFI